MSSYFVTYDLGDTANGIMSPSSLHQEVNESDITIKLLRVIPPVTYSPTIDQAGGDPETDFQLEFADDLPGVQKVDILDVIIAEHEGQPLTKDTESVQIDGPHNNDGKIEVVPAPGYSGWKTWFAGRSDQISPQLRGGGSPWVVEVQGGTSGTIELEFFEPVEIHDGQGNWDATFSHEDYIDFFVEFPATASTPTTTGNANKTQLQAGVYMFVPASGYGNEQIDLTAAVPIPKQDGIPAYWNADYETGVITPAPLGDGEFMLLDVPSSTAYFMIGMPMGHRHGVLDVDVYKTDWVHHNWKPKIKVTKTTAGSGKFSLWLLTYRPKNTP